MTHNGSTEVDIKNWPAHTLLSIEKLLIKNATTSYPQPQHIMKTFNCWLSYIICEIKR